MDDVVEEGGRMMNYIPNIYEIDPNCRPLMPLFPVISRITCLHNHQSRRSINNISKGAIYVLLEFAPFHYPSE